MIHLTKDFVLIILKWRMWSFERHRWECWSFLKITLREPQIPPESCSLTSSFTIVKFCSCKRNVPVMICQKFWGICIFSSIQGFLLENISWHFLLIWIGGVWSCLTPCSSMPFVWEIFILSCSICFSKLLL